MCKKAIVSTSLYLRLSQHLHHCWKTISTICLVLNPCLFYVNVQLILKLAPPFQHFFFFVPRHDQFPHRALKEQGLVASWAASDPSSFQGRMAWSACTLLWLWLWGSCALHFVVQTQDFPSWRSSEPLSALQRVRILSYCPVHLWGMRDFLEFPSLQENLLEHLPQSLSSCSLYIWLPPAPCISQGFAQRCEICLR